MNHNLFKYLCIFSLIYLVVMPSTLAYPIIIFADNCNSSPYDSTKWFWTTENANTEIATDGIRYMLKGTTISYYWQRLGSKIGYTSNYFDINFSISTGGDLGNYLFGVVNFDEINSSSYTDGIYWWSTGYNQLVTIATKSDGAEVTHGDLGNLPTTETKYRIQYNGSYLIASISDVVKYEGAINVNFDSTVGILFAAEASNTRYLSIYDVSASFIGIIQESNTTIDIFTQNTIDSGTINLVSEIMKLYIDVVKSAVAVGQVIYENIIDITTTVIKIGQSTLTIIAQTSTYIFSGIKTLISSTITYIYSGIKILVDSIIVNINSFNSLIDSIITTFETLYDEDTVYGSIIRVIPLILLLSIPTIVVYYKIGEFATIPMFMFMSIVAYMTSLMPLWILVVALIGCITILIQKQRRSN